MKWESCFTGHKTRALMYTAFWPRCYFMPLILCIVQCMNTILIVVASFQLHANSRGLLVAHVT